MNSLYNKYLVQVDFNNKAMTLQLYTNKHPDVKGGVLIIERDEGERFIYNMGIVNRIKSTPVDDL